MPQRNALANAKPVNELASLVEEDNNAVDLTQYIMQARKYGIDSIKNPAIQYAVARRIFGMFNTSPSTFDPNLSIYGASGGQVMTENPLETPYVMPDILHGRAGVDARVGRGTLSGGVSGALIRMPDGTVKPYSGSFDVGYGVPVGGGELSLGASTPIEPVMGSRPINFNANYRRRF